MMITYKTILGGIEITILFSGKEFWAVGAARII
jgi:hypothetical protein